MDFRDLKYFLVIAEEEHLGKAAEKLFKTQPALTKAVDRLEEQLGAELFERVGRGIRLTEVGHALLVRARQITFMLDDTGREISDFAQGRSGNIRLGCTPTLAETSLPELCEQLLKEASKIQLDLKVAMNDVLLDNLRSGDLDLVLGPMVQTDDIFQAEEIARDKMVVIASPKHPIFNSAKITMRSLLEYQWVLPAKSVASRQWLDSAFDKHRMPRPSVQITTTTLSMVMPLIARGSLLGFASKLNLEADRGNLREVVLKETTMDRKLGLTYRKDMYLSPAAKRFISIVKRHIRPQI